MKAPVIDKNALIYAKSLDINELKEAIIEVSKAKNSMAYNDVKDGLTNLLNRLLLKFSILCYFDSKYEEYDKFENRINDILKNIDDNSLIKPLVLQYKDYIGKIDELLNSYRLIKRILFEDGVLTQDKKIVEIQINEIETLINKLSKFDSICFESGVKMINVKQKVIDDIKDFQSNVIIEKTNLINKESDKLASQFITEIKQFNFEYMPYVNFEKEANTILVHSPIKEEVELLVYAYSKKYGNKMMQLNCINLKNNDESKINMLFEALDRKGYDIYIDDINHVRPSIETNLYTSLIKYGKKGHKVFIFDNQARNDKYNEVLNIIKDNSSLTSLDISYLYLSCPQYQELIKILVEKKMLESEQDELAVTIQKEMPFIGFTGFNEIILDFISNQNWVNKGKIISIKNNTDQLKKYIKEIPNLSLFIDEGWKIEDNKDNLLTNRNEFDYDRLRNISLTNIKKILNSEFNIFEKCGNIVRYCLLAGEDVTSFATLSEDEKKDRINQAIGCIYSILEVDIEDYKCEIHPSLGSNEGVSGRCVQNGKVIELKRKLISTVSDELIGTICHECFHAFQFYCIYNGYKQWYFDELGIRKSRIKQWTENINVYINNDNYNAYRYQIIEADTYAFELDCLESSKQSWDKIKFE